MVTNQTIAVRTTKRLVSYLTEKGIKTDTDYSYLSIKKSLRDCWYVKKLLDTGHTECVHVELPDAGAFICVLDDGQLMTGSNVMIANAIWAIWCEYVKGDDFNSDVYYDIAKVYADDWGDNGLLIFDFNAFQKWLNAHELYEKSHNETISEPF